MIAHHIPIDSADAREMRELEAERQREKRAAASTTTTLPPSTSAPTPEAAPVDADPPPAQRPAGEHDTRCADGWLGEDSKGRPRPCPHCRPHLTDVQHCTTCGARPSACQLKREQYRDPCCDSCSHPATARREPSA